VAFHDPCYLGRHNGVYDAPRNLLNVLSNSVVELDRNRENSFCCGAGGAQFWKEEEPGNERISDNRYREAERRLAGADDKVLAVGCPFCKSMLDSTPGKGAAPLPVRDIAELLLEGVKRKAGKNAADLRETTGPLSAMEQVPAPEPALALVQRAPDIPAAEAGTATKSTAARETEVRGVPASEAIASPSVSSAPVLGERKKWSPKPKAAPPALSGDDLANAPAETTGPPAVALESVREVPAPASVERKKWVPKSSSKE
jgi:hypothetical protein